MLTRTGAQRIPMSRDEFFRRAGDSVEGLRDWEEGTAVKMAAAHGRHGFFTSRLMNHVHEYLKAKDGGRVWTELLVDFGLKVYGVDLAVLLKEHLDRYSNGRIDGAPDMILEVLSPDSTERDRVDKFEAYYRQGVPWYWIGDAEMAIIEEYRHTPSGYVRSSTGTLQRPFEPEALPGLRVPLDDLMDL